MDTSRFCRTCARLMPTRAFRRARGASYRRTCRACESRSRMRRRWVSSGRPVPQRYADPELSLGTHLRILEAELQTREIAP